VEQRYVECLTLEQRYVECLTQYDGFHPQELMSQNSSHCIQAQCKLTSLILHYILLRADHDTLSGNIPLICLDRETTSQLSLGVTAKSLKDSHHYSWETILLKLEREKIGNHTLSVRSIHAFRHAFLHD